MFRTATSKHAQSGFSIVELLVGTVVAMLAILVIFNAFAMFEGQRRSSTTTNDVQATGMLALQAIERDMRGAGYGLTVNNKIISNVLACPTITAYQTSATVSIPLMPISIVDGGTAAGSSDSITALSSNSPFGSTPAMLSSAIATSSDDLAVNNTAGTAVFNTNDYFLIAQPLASPAKNCVRLRVTGTTNLGTSVKLLSASTDPANPPSSTNILPSGGFDDAVESPAIVINMGSMPRPQYTASGGSLTYQDLTGGGAAVTLANGVVALKALYGISDTTTANSQAVTQWVRATNNTAGTWNAPTAAMIPKIKAVRVAIVVRSSLLEKDNVTGTCTNNAGTNNGPCAWSDTATNKAPLINLSNDANWQRYRYRVFETIIPLRNVIWGNV
jgi:type IV pilus assembly protein PilW